MREAKQRGGAQACAYDGPLDARSRLRAALDTEIADGLARHEFTVFYQPQVALDSGLVVGLEALLRWRHPTRGDLVGEATQVERVVRELQRLGVRIAIGQFNVGYAASRFLRQLQVSQVKLDGGYVRDLPGDADSAVVVAAFVDLARRLDYEVVAEGVETREQCDRLRAIGCGVGQGFHFAIPMSAAELASWVAINRRQPFR